MSITLTINTTPTQLSLPTSDAWSKNITFDGKLIILPLISHSSLSDTVTDYLELTALMFDWGDSYDAKVISLLPTHCTSPD